MKKLLFISIRDVEKRSNGGELCTNRNYLSFCKLLGRDNVELVNVMKGLKKGYLNVFYKRINYFRGFNEGISKKKLAEILAISKDVNFVFIDSSIHGAIAYHLSKGGYNGQILSFFHNVEFIINLQKVVKEPWKIPELLVTRYNEKMACRYADKIISVNQRDKLKLAKFYNKLDVSIIPISLIDTFRNGKNISISNPPSFIFMGNNWYPNIHGLNWFIENVLDYVNIKLIITGSRMKSLAKMYSHPKIEFLGFVDDLYDVLSNADYVLSPIFKGSGMKVKTCEALMYGKSIIGTPESFQGYDIDPQKVGRICGTKQEFVTEINNLCKSKEVTFNQYNRRLFIEKYSFNATLKKFKEVLIDV